MDALSDEQFDAWMRQQQEQMEAEKNAISELIVAEKLMGAITVPLEMRKSPKRPRKKLKVTLQELTLLPNQTEHVERLRAILDKYPFALDLSMLGAGKTFTSSFLAKHGLAGEGFKHVIVVCPVSVLPKWRTMSDTYGIPITHALGYQALRSSKHRQPKHGLLHRRDVLQGVLSTVSFTSTDEYKAMVDEGALLIFDEVQNIKNISSQFHAAQALIHEITRRPGSGIVSNAPTLFQRVMGVVDDSTPCTSRVLLLSGSPIDQKEHATHIFRALGVMMHDRVAQMNIHTRRNEWRGMQEIYDFCDRASPTTATIASQVIMGESKLDPYIYRLFQGVLKPTCSSAMHPPPPPTTLTKVNAFYDVDDGGAEIISRGLNSLKRAARFDGANVNLRGNGEQMAGVTRAMQVIETGKIQMFARVARQKLAMPCTKVVIAVNYTDTVTDLKALLLDFNPLLLVGSTSETGRKTVLNKFQAPSTEHRLLICNQLVASTGIDLDDKHGGFPRACLVSPNYSTITSYQLGHRFQRLDTKSDAHVHFVFAKRSGGTRESSEDIIELRVLHALSRKSQIMRETTGEGTGIVFPGDHPEWLESGTSSGRIEVRRRSRTQVLMQHFFETRSPMRQVYFADQFTRYREHYGMLTSIKLAMRDVRSYVHFVGPLTRHQSDVRDSVRTIVDA